MIKMNNIDDINNIEAIITCPITCQIFVDPVVAEDGFTYEKTAILTWLKKKSISPMTKKPISKNIYPNILIKQIKNEYLEKNPEKKSSVSKSWNSKIYIHLNFEDQ